jgi:hypothetical protein
MVRSAIVIVATLVLLLGIAPISQPQAQNDGSANMPSHSKAAPTKGRWSEWRQNRPKLKACRAEARKKGLAGDDRWFFLESCLGRS